MEEKKYRDLYLMYNDGFFVGVVELYGNVFPSGYKFYKIPYELNFNEEIGEFEKIILDKIKQ